jgi:diguanylate cyclase (GGDEF)-like protein
MDYDTLLFVWDAFSFILFAVVILSTLHEPKGLRKNSNLVIASLLMFVALFLYYRETRFLSEGIRYSGLAFVTYAFSAGSQMMIITMITHLYKRNHFTKKVFLLILGYALLSGVVMEIDSIYGSYVSKHLLIGVINGIPQLHLITFIIIYAKKWYQNIFTIQVVSLMFIYGSRSYIIFTDLGNVSFETASNQHIGLFMIANVIIYSYFISYLIVKGIKTTNELHYHKGLVESSLTNAIRLSEIDPLTKIYNRRKIVEIIKEFEQFEYGSTLTFSIIIADVNSFKEINDKYGHTTGDEVLVFIASTIKDAVRKQDVCARWGGDEFLVLLPETDYETATYVAEKIKKNFKTMKCELIDNFVDLSFGVSTSSETKHISDLIDIADQRMYQRKL